MDNLKFTESFMIDLLTDKFSSSESAISFINENKNNFDWCSKNYCDYLFCNALKFDSNETTIKVIQNMIEEKLMLPSILMVQSAMNHSEGIDWFLKIYPQFKEKTMSIQALCDVVLKNADKNIYQEIEKEKLKIKSFLGEINKSAICKEVN